MQRQQLLKQFYNICSLITCKITCFWLGFLFLFGWLKYRKFRSWSASSFSPSILEENFLVSTTIVSIGNSIPEFSRYQFFLNLIPKIFTTYSVNSTDLDRTIGSEDQNFTCNWTLWCRYSILSSVKTPENRGKVKIFKYG